MHACCGRNGSTAYLTPIAQMDLRYAKAKKWDIRQKILAIHD